MTSLCIDTTLLYSGYTNVRFILFYGVIAVLRLYVTIDISKFLWLLMIPDVSKCCFTSTF